MGKDKDDIFWQLGKVHGIENIALVDEKKLLSTGGDPFRLQNMVDTVNDQEKEALNSCHDSVADSLNNDLESYKDHLSKIDSNKQFASSDMKKMLTMPFKLSKRSELPEPKYGQKEWDVFTKLYGRLHNDFEDLNFDDEFKITEFNYEDFISEYLLDDALVQDEGFKDTVKLANLTSSTEFEQHKLNQQEFKELMPLLSSLNEEETEILVHMIRNKGRQLDNSSRRSDVLTDNACNDEIKSKLAKLSEDENFALKNRWFFQK